MKYLIIFLMSLNVFAIELPQDEVAKEQIKLLKAIDFDAINTANSLGLSAEIIAELEAEKGVLIKNRLSLIFSSAIIKGRKKVERDTFILNETAKINSYTLILYVPNILDRLIPNASYEFEAPIVGTKKDLYERLQVYKIVDSVKVYLDKPALSQFVSEFALYKTELINAL